MGVKEWRGFRKHFFSSFLLIDRFGFACMRFFHLSYEPRRFTGLSWVWKFIKGWMKRGICFVRDREGERESEGESGYGLMPDGCFHLIGVGLGRTSCVTPCSLLLQPSLHQENGTKTNQVALDLRH